MQEISYKPIGIIHSPHKKSKGTPIQPTANNNQTEGFVEIFPQYAEGLSDIENFSHIIIIYHFHLSKNFSLKVKPYMHNKEHGIFAVRAPSRPNPIGFSIVELLERDRNKLKIKQIDILDKTPVLDIKPFVAEFDNRNPQKSGWLKNNIHKLSNSKDDGRFEKK